MNVCMKMIWFIKLIVLTPFCWFLTTIFHYYCYVYISIANENVAACIKFNLYFVNVFVRCYIGGCLEERLRLPAQFWTCIPTSLMHLVFFTLFIWSEIKKQNNTSIHLMPKLKKIAMNATGHITCNFLTRSSSFGRSSNSSMLTSSGMSLSWGQHVDIEVMKTHIWIASVSHRRRMWQMHATILILLSVEKSSIVCFPAVGTSSALNALFICFFL